MLGILRRTGCRCRGASFLFFLLGLNGVECLVEELDDVDDLDRGMGFFQLFIAGEAGACECWCSVVNRGKVSSLSLSVVRVVPMVPLVATDWFFVFFC